MRRYAVFACASLATALFAGHPSKVPVKPVNVAIEPPPTTLGGPAAPRAKQDLAEEWNLADRVRAASVPSPTDSSRRHVAWRRLARGMNTDAETLRARWAACGHSGSPVLPLLEPWEVADGLVRGASKGEAVQLALAVGGADACVHNVKAEWEVVKRWEASKAPVNALEFAADAKALYDAALKENPAPSCQDKRTSLEVLNIRQRLTRMHGRWKWVSCERQIADGLTKVAARQLLADRLRRGVLRLATDKQYTAAKKKTPAEREEARRFEN